MSTPVHEALRRQRQATGTLGDYVFCTRTGSPLKHRNVTQRVWCPLLRHLGLKPRRPYQTRHTAATLWLAAGENPEWIARQLGHANTQMLFKVYSVPLASPSLCSARRSHCNVVKLAAERTASFRPMRPGPAGRCTSRRDCHRTTCGRRHAQASVQAAVARLRPGGGSA